MDQDKRVVIEKVKKLLALANSTNEFEAKLAAEQATRILTKHNLKMQDVQNQSKKYSTLLHETTRRRASTHDKFVFDIIMRFFFVEVIRGQKYQQDLGVDYLYDVFVGEEHNILIAEYVRAFLDRLFPAAFAEYKKRTGAPASHRKSYYAGLWGSISAKLAESRQAAEQEAGLVVVKDAGISKFIEEQFNTSRKSTTQTEVNNVDALTAGMEDGKNVNISMGLEGNTKQNNQIANKLALNGRSA